MESRCGICGKKTCDMPVCYSCYFGEHTGDAEAIAMAIGAMILLFGVPLILFIVISISMFICELLGFCQVYNL